MLTHFFGKTKHVISFRGTVTMICHDFNHLPLPRPRPKDGVCHTLNAEILPESHLLAGTPMFVAPHKLILKHVTFSKRRKSILLNVLPYVKCFRWKVGHKALTSTFSITTRHVLLKHGLPRRQRCQNNGKISKSNILTLSHPQRLVMSVKCEQY